MRLVRLREQNPKELAGWLHEAVWNNRSNLKLRYHVGAIARYGHSLQTAEKYAARVIATDEKAEIGKAGLMGYLATGDEAVIDDQTCGPVTLYRGLPLGRVLAPLPTGVTRRVPLLRERLRLLPRTVNVTGWTACGKELSLGPMYQLALAELDPDERPWTVEPVRTVKDTSQDVHRAIHDAGLYNAYGLTERYDVGEKGIPPFSQLLFRHPIFSDIGVG